GEFQSTAGQLRCNHVQSPTPARVPCPSRPNVAFAVPSFQLEVTRCSVMATGVGAAPRETCSTRAAEVILAPAGSAAATANASSPRRTRPSAITPAKNDSPAPSAIEPLASWYSVESALAETTLTVACATMGQEASVSRSEHQRSRMPATVRRDPQDG